MAAPTVFASRVLDLRPAFAAAGVEFDGALRDLGLDADALGIGSARVPHAAYAELWQRLDQVDDGWAGVRHAQRDLRIRSLDIVGFGMQTAATLWDALALLVRANSLVNPLAHVSVEQRGRDVVITDTPLPHGRAHAWSRGRAEHALAAYVFLGRQLAGVDLRASLVRLQHRRATGAEQLSRCFDAPVELGAAANQIVFTREALRAPLRGADDAIHDYFAAQIAARAPASTRSAEVRAQLAAGLHRGAGLRDVARALRVSPRTLQRELGREGTSFARLLDDLRRERAEWLVGHGELPLKRVQVELGFADARAFRRAFVRWTGTSPGHARRARRDRASGVSSDRGPQRAGGQRPAS
jgi:AraC-like DNA-binding protein